MMSSSLSVPRSVEYLEAKLLEEQNLAARLIRQLAEAQSHAAALEAALSRGNTVLLRQAAVHFTAQRVVLCHEESDTRLSWALDWLKETIEGRPAPKWLPGEWLSPSTYEGGVL